MRWNYTVKHEDWTNAKIFKFNRENNNKKERKETFSLFQSSFLTVHQQQKLSWTHFLAFTNTAVNINKTNIGCSLKYPFQINISRNRQRIFKFIFFVRLVQGKRPTLGFRQNYLQSWLNFRGSAVSYCELWDGASNKS